MALATKTRPPRVPIDLLPQEVVSEARTKKTFSYVVGAAVLVAVLLVGITMMVRMQIGDARADLADQQAQAAALQTQVGALAEFEVLQTSLEQTQGLLATALRNDISWSSFLDDLDTNMPVGSWLVSLNMAATPGLTPTGEASLGTAQYQGYVETFPGLSGWLDTMSELTGLRFVYLSNGAKQDLGGREVVSFNATAHLTEDMLSGRCQQEGSQCP